MKASTTITLSAAANKNGAGATLTATITPQHSGTPTGSVTFDDGSTQLATVSVMSGTAPYAATQ